MLRYFYLFFLCLVFSSGLYGVQYRLVGWPETISGLYCQSDKDMVPATIAFGAPSQYYSLPDGKDLTLYRKNELRVPGAPLYIPAANLPSQALASESNLVVVIPRGENAYYLKAINDSPQKYPVGSMVVCSFVPYKVGIKVEEEIFLLEYGDTVVPSPRSTGSHTRIQVAGYRKSDNRVRFNTNMLLRPNYRYFMIVQDTAVTPVPSMPEDNGLSVFFIPDYLASPVIGR